MTCNYCSRTGILRFTSFSVKETYFYSKRCFGFIMTKKSDLHLLFRSPFSISTIPYVEPYTTPKLLYLMITIVYKISNPIHFCLYIFCLVCLSVFHCRHYKNILNILFKTNRSSLKTSAVPKIYFVVCPLPLLLSMSITNNW